MFDLRRTAYSGLAALCVSACVEARVEPAQGTAQFAVGGLPTNADYAPASPATLPGDTSTVAQSPLAAGSGAEPPVFTPLAGSAGPAIGGAGMAGVAGTGGASLQGGTGGTPLLGAAGMQALAGSGGSPAVSSGAGTLTIAFTSVNQGGRYAPRNVGAVWVEDAGGTFVKTLKRWAGIRANHLTAWRASSGGWSSFFGIGATPDELDAVTAATLRTHQAHQITWDMKDNMEQLVPDGSYKVFIEVTEDNFIPGAYGEVTFEKGAMPQSVDAPDQAPWAGLTVSYQP